MSGPVATTVGRVGIVGAGQLARMTAEAASSLGVPVVVLAERKDDCATEVAGETLVGSPGDEDAMARLARRSAVVTFDHEQVDLAVVAALERRGTRVRPCSETLEVAVDKAAMRGRLEAAGIPVPAYRVLGAPGAEVGPDEVQSAVERFASTRGWPVVLKAARGGYDGKGVWPVAGPRDAAEVVGRAARATTPLLVEEHVGLDAELAVTVARRDDGDTVAWPAVETTQVRGVCREVLVPGTLGGGLRSEASDLAREVAAVVGAVGVLAVELFSAGGRLLVNELAARPHNSAHWTIEGARTSQFENHLRAVLDLPLGDPSCVFPHVATVNVFGAAGADGPAPDPRGLLPAALAIPGVHVHLYGKAPRPGRKLGHVTVCGDDPTEVRRRAWAAARALGTPAPGS